MLSVMTQPAWAQPQLGPAVPRCSIAGVGPAAAKAAGPTEAVVNSAGTSSANSETPASRAAALIAKRPVDGMVLSTGNIYFTSHDASGAQVFRTGQTSSPGEERRIYCEDPGSRFGDIVWAQIGSNYYGYFWVLKQGNSFIKRISLAGSQTAGVLTPPINDIDIENSHHNLVTDGKSLFWQQGTTVKKMSIGGGPIGTLDHTRPNTPTAGVYLRGRELIYANVEAIIRVPTEGTDTAPVVRTLVTAGTTVTTILPVSNGIYWGDRDGGLKLKVGNTNSTISSSGGVTSIGTSGSTASGDLFWTQCGGGGCQVGFRVIGGSGTSPAGASPLGAAMNSSGKAFWGDENGVHRAF
jgi:hypothetical protein